MAGVETNGDGAPAPASRYRVDVLGPCRLVALDCPDAEGRDLTEVRLTGLQRAVLARLAVAAPGVVRMDGLIEAGWGSEPPATVRNALQNQISNLRALTSSDLVLTAAAGYALGPTVTTDVRELVTALERGQRLIAAGQPDEAWMTVDVAVGRARGEPAPELDHLADLAPLRAWAGAVVEAARVLRVEAAMLAGRTAWALPEAERLVTEDPLDEARWALLVRGLAVVGRRGDALSALDRARRTLRDELGLDPGPQLRAAERDVLAAVEGRSAVAPRPRLALRGRRADLERITAEVVAGRSVVVVGDEGSGRSAVLAAAVMWLRRAGRRVAVATLDRHPSVGVAALTDLLEELGQSGPARLGPVDGFVAALAQVASRGPLVLVVDDLHLAGPTTTAALGRATTVPGVAVLASLLAGEGPGIADAAEVWLGPLDDEAVAGLVADLSPELVAAEQVDRVVALAGGNPAVATCLVEDLGSTDLEAGGAATLTTLARRRVARLRPAALRAVELAAVVGGPVRRAVIERIATPAALDEALDDGVLITHEEVGTDALIMFRMPALALAIATDLAPGRRTESHLALAAAERDAGAPAAVVAAHLLEAAAIDAPAAHAAAVRAAADATATGAHADAAAWLHRAADIARTFASEGEVIGTDVALGDALRLAGEPGHVELLLGSLARALELGDAGLISDAAFALLQLGGTSEAGPANERAIAAAEVALVALEGDPRWAVVAGATSLACSLTGLADRSRELFLAAEGRATDADVRRRVLPFTYLGLGHVDDLDRREAFRDELLTLADAAGDPVAAFEGHHLAFSVALMRADGSGVRSALAAMDALVERVGDVGRRWQLLYCAAAVAHLDDDLARAEELAAASMAVFAGVSAARAFAAYGSQLLLLRLAEGRVAELTPAFDGLVASQPQVGAWHGLLALCVAGDEPERAAHHAHLALDAVPRDFTWLASHVMAARATAHAAAGGARDAPVAAYRRLLAPYAGVVAWQGTCSYGPVASALAALAVADGDGAAASAYARTARELAATLDAPVFAREVDHLIR